MRESYGNDNHNTNKNNDVTNTANISNVNSNLGHYSTVDNWHLSSSQTNTNKGLCDVWVEF